MAGQLTIDTLKASSGVLATQNGMTGIAKAWGSYAFVGAGSVPTVNSAFNISSITRNSTGNFTFAFTTTMPNALYSAVTNANQGSTTSNQSISFTTAKSTSSFTVQCVYPASPTAYDFGVDFTVFSA